MLLTVDAIAEYRTASEANDVDRLVDTLAPDAELISPLLARRVIRGKKDLRLLLAAVYGTVRAALDGRDHGRRPGLHDR